MTLTGASCSCSPSTTAARSSACSGSTGRSATHDHERLSAAKALVAEALGDVAAERAERCRRRPRHPHRRSTTAGRRSTRRGAPASPSPWRSSAAARRSSTSSTTTGADRARGRPAGLRQGADPPSRRRRSPATSPPSSIDSASSATPARASRRGSCSSCSPRTPTPSAPATTSRAAGDRPSGRASSSTRSPRSRTPASTPTCGRSRASPTPAGCAAIAAAARREGRDRHRRGRARRRSAARTPSIAGWRRQPPAATPASPSGAASGPTPCSPTIAGELDAAPPGRTSPTVTARSSTRSAQLRASARHRWSSRDGLDVEHGQGSLDCSPVERRRSDGANDEIAEGRCGRRCGTVLRRCDRHRMGRHGDGGRIHPPLTTVRQRCTNSVAERRGCCSTASKAGQHVRGRHASRAQGALHTHRHPTRGSTMNRTVVLSAPSPRRHGTGVRTAADDVSNGRRARPRGTSRSGRWAPRARTSASSPTPSWRSSPT